MYMYVYIYNSYNINSIDCEVIDYYNLLGNTLLTVYTASQLNAADLLH